MEELIILKEPFQLVFAEGKNLVFEIGGNFIFKGGWVLSWTTYLFGGLILGLIIWNILLTQKINKFAPQKESEVKR